MFIQLLLQSIKTDNVTDDEEAVSNEGPPLVAGGEINPNKAEDTAAMGAADSGATATGGAATGAAATTGTDTAATGGAATGAAATGTDTAAAGAVPPPAPAVFKAKKQVTFSICSSNVKL